MVPSYLDAIVRLGARKTPDVIFAYWRLALGGLGHFLPGFPVVERRDNTRKGP
jgi:hypothetical protein